MFYYERMIPDAVGCIVEHHRFKKGHMSILHWHNFGELELVVSGAGNHRLDGTEYGFTAGDCWITGGISGHSIFFEEETEIINIIFSSDMLDARLAELLDIHTALRCHCSGQFADAISRNAAELQNASSYGEFSRLYSSSLLTQLLLSVLHTAGIDRSAQLPLVKSAAAWASRHFPEDARISTMAKELGVSPNHLGKLFRGATGISFNDYIRNLRLRRVCYLLTSTELSIKEIGYSAGFKSTEYFYEVFRKYIGVQPSAYRHKYRLLTDPGQ